MRLRTFVGSRESRRALQQSGLHFSLDVDGHRGGALLVAVAWHGGLCYCLLIVVVKHGGVVVYEVKT